jgi:DNA-binding transcriptional regulator of glucitol operon
MVLLAVVVCLRLGWWQWDRTHESDGTVQNLGYAVLWPLFGVAFIYMWLRFLHLEVVKDAEDDAELTELAAGDQIAGPSDSGSFEPAGSPDPDLTSGQVVSAPGDASINRDIEATPPEEIGQEEFGEQPAPSTSGDRNTPPRGYTIAVSTVGNEDQEEDDPELAAYNRALAALAEKDHRRAR